MDFTRLKQVIKGSLTFITSSETRIRDFNDDHIYDILQEFDDSLYTENNMLVSEEEFVFDFLNNSKIKEKIQ